MKKNFLYIAALVLMLIIVDHMALPKGIGYALGVALGIMIGAILLSAIRKRKKI
jgi:Na+-translocating ferredoxin:NAD+ oxidoreductase RnfA subunit